MKFVSYDGSVKRWHSKVFHAAENLVRSKLQGLDIPVLRHLIAESDASPTAVPHVVIRYNNRYTFRVVRFATYGWASVDTAIEDAATQLSAAVISLARNSQVKNALHCFSPDRYVVAVRRDREPDDHNEHSTIYLTQPIGSDRFSEIVDALETELRIANVGEVSGTGWSVDGSWSVDISGPSTVAYCDIVAEVLNNRAVPYRIRSGG
jgi:hypothetical protein